MYQKFIKTESTAQRCSTMETRDHSKNGASPKSLMSRGNIKYMLLFICLFAVNAYSQCPFTGNGTQANPWNISDNTSSGNSVYAYVSGSTLTIYGNGNMADFWNSLGGEAPWNNPNCYSNPAAIQTVVFQTGNTITNIGRRAFKGLQNLQGNIIIPSTVTKINAQAFLNCTHSNFQSITIPISVIEIEGEAFKSCAAKTITIAEGNGNLTFKRPQISGTYYVDWFENCQMQTLILGRPYTRESGEPPFKGRIFLQNLTIGKNVNTLESEAFNNCTNLKNVIIDDHTVELAFSYPSYNDGHFNGSHIENLYIGRNIKATGGGINVNPFAGNLASANAIVTIGNDVTAINPNSFHNCTGLKTLTITTGSKLNSIGNNAFFGCSSLKSPLTTLPEIYFATIGNGAFQGCQNLPALTIPKSCTSIGSQAFNGCISLKNVNIIGHTVELAFSYPSYNDGHFNGCQIDTLLLGRNIKATGGGINVNPFAGNLASENAIVTIGNDVTAINPNSFHNCTGLKTLTITTGSKLNSIGNNAFFGCSSLKSPLTTLPEIYFVTIGDGAFKGCQNLPALTIPKSCTSIGSQAFNGCTSLKNVNIVGHTVELAFSYPSYNDGHFNGCQIDTLLLGRNIKATGGGINVNPFAGNLASANATLTIGNNVTAINTNSFTNCTGLQLITLQCCTPPTFGSNAFLGVGQNIPVIVPCGCFNNYHNSPWHNYFTNIQNPVGCQSILTVLTSKNEFGHATSINKLTGAPLTSTWNFGGSFTPATSIPFSGEVILLANAKKNCAFMGWSDGNIEPMRIVDITANVTYTAQFANVEGMEELLAQIAELLGQINVLKDSINNLKLQNENLQAQIDSLQKLLDDCINSQKVPSFDFPSLKIYPNPAKDNVTVVLSENTVGTLALFDLSGKIVRRQSVNDNIATVDIASLSVGTYILRLVKDGVAGAGVKIVKE